MADGADRRQHLRLENSVPVMYWLSPTSGEPRRSLTKNISGGGVCLFLDKELPLGTVLQVSMNLPGRATLLTFTGEIVWCEPYEVIGKTQRHKAIEAGVRITDIAPQDHQAMLDHVILSLQAPHK